MTDLNDVIERLRGRRGSLQWAADKMSHTASNRRKGYSEGCAKAVEFIDPIIRDLEALRDRRETWPEDRGQYIGVPVEDDPDRHE